MSISETFSLYLWAFLSIFKRVNMLMIIGLLAGILGVGLLKVREMVDRRYEQQPKGGFYKLVKILNILVAYILFLICGAVFLISFAFGG